MTTAVYRRAVDAAWQALTASSSSGGGGDARFAADKEAAAELANAGRLRLSGGDWQDLQQVFARGQDASNSGLTPGFLEGSQHQQLVRGRNPRHRGNYLGAVQRVSERKWRSGSGARVLKVLWRGCRVGGGVQLLLCPSSEPPGRPRCSGAAAAAGGAAR